MSQLAPLVALSSHSVRVLLEVHNSQGIFCTQNNRDHLKVLTKLQFLQAEDLAYTITPEGADWLRHAGLIH